MSPFHWLLAVVAAQRLVELLLSARNTRRLKAAGAIEYGAGHYPLLVLLHAAWLMALAVSVPADAAISRPLLVLFLALQAGRIWVIVTLGSMWTTRVISRPGAPLVRRGPYRFCRHPNYLIVIAEIALLPLMVGAWRIALVFSALNLLLLRHRVAVEEAALADRMRLP